MYASCFSAISQSSSTTIQWDLEIQKSATFSETTTTDVHIYVPAGETHNIFKNLQYIFLYYTC